MIDQALKYVRKELGDRLPNAADDEVMIESARVLSGQNTSQGAYITLVSVEEEPALRNVAAVERVGSTLQRREPPVHLNLYLLFSFEFQSYELSLQNLSDAIGIFQQKRVYDAATASPGNPFPPGLERLVFEIHNMSFEALNNLWSVMGGAYFPSVVYKVRLVQIQVAPQVPASEILSIDHDVGLGVDG